MNTIRPKLKMCRKSGNPQKKSAGIGMPDTLLLQQFGSVVWDAFGHIPYQVGSSLDGATWRDVDVRLILGDEEYEKMFPLEGVEHPGEQESHTTPKWVALVLAFSLLGKEMTGLPIDFQIQKQTEANKRYSGMRSALGITGHRIARGKK